MAPPKATEEIVLYVVVEPFLGPNMIAYRKGEVIHPDDPQLKAMPERFRPFEFPHPVKRRGALALPEIRAGE